MQYMLMIFMVGKTPIYFLCKMYRRRRRKAE